MIEIVPYTEKHIKIWDDLVPRCKNSTFIFSRSYMDYHKDRFCDNSLIIFEDNRPVGLFPANRKNETTVISHEGLTYGGLLMVYNEYTENALKYLVEILKYYYDNGIKNVYYKQIPSFYCSVSCEEIDYAMFLANAKIDRVDINSVIDLNPQEKIDYQRRRKAGIKNAKKNNVKVIEVDHLNQFWDEILIPNLQKRHCVNPLHTINEIEELLKKNKCRIRQFNAFHEDRIMAGCTIYEMKNVVRAQYFSGCDEGRQNGSLDYLIHYLIDEVFNDKKYFDFGNSNTNQGLKINAGLLGWKEGFGARTYAQRFYDIETANYQLIGNAFL